jgi:hypothetical protein
MRILQVPDFSRVPARTGDLSLHRRDAEALAAAGSRLGVILPVIILVACCIDSPPFVPVSQPPTIEVGDKGITTEQIDKLEPGVVYAITQNGKPTSGTIEIGSSPESGGMAIETGPGPTREDVQPDLNNNSYYPAPPAPTLVVSP